jgi:hypothetical protein
MLSIIKTIGILGTSYSAFFLKTRNKRAVGFEVANAYEYYELFMKKLMSNYSQAVLRDNECVLCFESGSGYLPLDFVLPCLE